MSSFPLLLYNHEAVDVTVTLDNETLRLNQDQMSQIFGTERLVITKHIRNVLKEWELEQNSVCAFFAHLNKKGMCK